jgi:RNA polymerase sigma-70 factor (ECF subfamily)
LVGSARRLDEIAGPLDVPLECVPLPGEGAGRRADLVLGLFDETYERVYGFLRRSTSAEVAEDLAQEVYVRLLAHPQLEALTISISYLFKIAHNLLRRRCARAARLRELLEDRGPPPIVSDSPAAPLLADAALLETALGLLSVDEHNAVRLIICEGKSYQHAAESLGVSVSTINNWKHRGITKLRRYLAEGDEGVGEGLDAGSRRRGDDARPDARPQHRGRSARSPAWREPADEVA